jgi:transcriptional regulator with XRE-family HTH domain
MVRSSVGPLVREWRARRHRSQMDLAYDVGVSPRHLSFVETGKSRPSPELLLAIADELDIPLRERNTLLRAAGHAPRYAQTSFDDPSMQAVRTSIRRLLDAHAPYPGMAIDRHWDVVDTNDAARLLTTGVPRELLGPPTNVYRVSMHPEGLAPRTLDFATWALYQLRLLKRAIVLTGDPVLRDLYDEVHAYPNVAALGDATTELRDEPAPLLLPFRLAIGDRVLSFFTTLTAFGTPFDITVEELAIELFFPADRETDALLHA